MLSKCANPECSETLLYLHQGQIFRLAPSANVEMAAGTALSALLHERFWLCDSCSRQMTVVWDGSQAKIVRLVRKTPRGTCPPRTPAENPVRSGRRAKRLATAGCEGY